MSVMFWLFKAKLDKKGVAPLYVKITIDGEDVDLSIGKKMAPEFWDTETKRNTEGSREAEDINFRILEVQKDLERIFENLCREYQYVQPQMVKNIFNGKSANWSALEEKKQKETKHTLVEVVDAKMEELQLQVNAKLMKSSTHTTWKTSKKHILDFISYYSGGKDILLSDIKQDFARELVAYLTLHKEEPLSPITTERRVIHLKAFLDYAVEKEWLDKNRVQNFQYNPKSKKVTPLEYSDVIKLHAKIFENDKLNIIKDMFIFQCFTGFAYAELADLTAANIVDHGGRGKCLVRDRQKTMSTELVPMLPIVEEIVNRYHDHPLVLKTGKLLPIISNQKYNDYLKPVGTIAGFSRPLTTHLARHTFAHIMLNHFFLPLEDVSLMMGHQSMKTTKQYCQVGKERLMKSMSSVHNQMKDIDGQHAVTNWAS